MYAGSFDTERNACQCAQPTEIAGDLVDFQQHRLMILQACTGRDTYNSFGATLKQRNQAVG